MYLERREAFGTDLFLIECSIYPNEIGQARAKGHFTLFSDATRVTNSQKCGERGNDFFFDICFESTQNIVLKI